MSFSSLVANRSKHVLWVLFAVFFALLLNKAVFARTALPEESYSFCIEPPGATVGASSLDFKLLADAPLYCCKCGKRISGTYYKLNGGIYCVNDFEKYRKYCSKCGQPISGTYYTKNGQVFCAKDQLLMSPVCVLCKKHVGQATYTIYDGGSVCKACSAKYHNHCFVCSMPVQPQACHLSDGRFLCSKHSQNIITANAKAQGVLRTATSAIIQLFGPQMKLSVSKLPIQLVDVERMARLDHSKVQYDQSMDSYGLCYSVLKGKKWRHTIYALSGLQPRTLFSICAHEYAHAWQHENNPNLIKSSTKSVKQSRFQEGFAQWVAYKVNQHMHRQDQLDFLLLPKDNVYGQGLREYLAIEKKSGINGVFRYARGE